MAGYHGIAVTKENMTFRWRTGPDIWQFRQWPEQRLWRNGICLSYLANGCGLKLVEDAVLFSLGYQHGRLNGLEETGDPLAAS